MLNYRGINYDTGINYVPGELSRINWDISVAKNDMQIIANDLNCTSVNIFGSSLDRLASCAYCAVEAGLNVWLQPRLIDHSQQEVIEHLIETAKIASRLAADGADTFLHLGCELTIFLPGIIHGNNYEERIERLNQSWFAPFGTTKRLNTYLNTAQKKVREVYDGPLTYAAGEWERIDWRNFDVIGVNLYREASNRWSYTHTLKNYVASKKPFVVTEFGTCAYVGAEKAGGGGHDIVNYDTTPPTIDPKIVRDEEAQADHLEEMIKLYDQVGVSGCFVYAFSEPTNTYSIEPSLDLDKASYGIVRTLTGDPTGGSWEPKIAFKRLASVYHNNNFQKEL